MAVVAQLTGVRDTGESTPLDALRNLCAADLARVNQLIIDHMQSEVPLIPQLAGHLIAAGGKRLRPLLTLASARLCNYRGDDHIGLAAAVEFIHTATLLHDDVVDESDLRRGRDTANAVWGNQASVLVGDFLFSRAFRLMVQSDSMRVLDILANASAVIAEGEVAQLTTANDTDTDEDGYLNVIRAKTAALFAAACKIGAVIGDRPDNEETALDQYGLNLGIAFQLVDDYLDYGDAHIKLGKAVGDDFRAARSKISTSMKATSTMRGVSLSSTMRCPIRKSAPAATPKQRGRRSIFFPWVRTARRWKKSSISASSALTDATNRARTTGRCRRAI